MDYPVLTAANGESVVVSGHPAENVTFDFYMRSIGRDDLIGDERFADTARRLQHLDEIHALLRDWARTMPDPHSIETAMSANRLAVGKLRSVREVCDTEWGREREVTVRVSDRGTGSIRIPNSPWRFEGSDVSVTGEPRYRGEDNRGVLTAMLGLADDEVDALEASGVLSSRVPRRD
jgi:crotonobetainyl-CoA:carnitine CoA-transferase CaiB-like acyl-CoA transferase